MKENSNKIVIGIAAVLAVLMIALAFGSDACSSGGGGAPANPQGTSSASSASASSSSAQGSASGSASYTEQRDKLMSELSAGTAPVGANPRSASAEAGVMTVASAVAELASRGFIGASLTASFDMNGNYLGATALDSTSPDKYPSYQMTWRSSQGVEWKIAVNASALFAMPVSADTTSIAKGIIFSETDSVTQYDGTRNEYSDFAFAELDGKTGVKVARIDAQTLESYSADALGRM